MAEVIEQHVDGPIQQHNERPAAVWSSGGSEYDEISRGIADAIEHCVLRLNPIPGERILDLSTGTGWTSRVVAKRGATVVGADIATGLLEAARSESESRTARDRLPYWRRGVAPVSRRRIRRGCFHLRHHVRQPS